jgi:hypothetical protein
MPGFLKDGSMEKLDEFPDLPGAPSMPHESRVPTPEPRPLPRMWPAPDTKFGAFFYAVVGGLVVWLLVDVLPQHLSIRWH